MRTTIVPFLHAFSPIRICICVSATLLGASCNQGEKQAATPADLILEGGTVFLDVNTTTDQIAIREGLVVATGDAVESVDGNVTEHVDLAGGVVVPGFHDSHVHLLAGSFVLDRLVLLGASSMDRIIGDVEDYAAEAPDEPWIVGYGWMRELVEEPSGVAIDEVVNDRPVMLADNSGHSVLVNSYAMTLAGISADTPDPEGGEIVRDADGNPTGYLKEEALSLVSEVALSAYDDSLLASGLASQLRTFTLGGVTGVSEILASPGFDLSRPWIYSELEAAGELDLRVHYYVPIFELADIERAVALAGTYDGELVRLVGGKVWVDGSMGNSEAWVSEALETDPDDYGASYFDTVELTELFTEAEAQGLALKLHANGDAAITAVLDAMEAVAGANGGLEQQHVLDHVVLIADSDLQRFAELGVVASVQPSHWIGAQFSDTVDDWGEERFESAYDYRALADAGVDLALGTDWPVWPTPDAIVQIWAAASARGEMGLSAKEALHAATSGSARGVGRSEELGNLHEGSLADMVLLDGDPLAVDPDELSRISVDAVWVGGRKVR